MNQSRSGNGHSLGEIVGGLAGDVQDLVKGEMALARAELEHKVGELLKSAQGGTLVDKVEDTARDTLQSTQTALRDEHNLQDSQKD